jgi:hypothetical protein
MMPVSRNSTCRSISDLLSESRFRLVTLEEIMDSFDAIGMMLSFRDIAIATASMDEFLSTKKRNATFSPDAALSETLANLTEHVKSLPVSYVTKHKLDRTAARLSDPNGDLMLGEASLLLKELLNDITLDAGIAMFLVVPIDDSFYYQEPELLFPQSTLEVFEVEEDAYAACRCLALNEWTASVFHLMRVLEIGLHELRTRLQLPPKPRNEWHHLITDIENEIGRLKGLDHKDKARLSDDVLTFYSDAAANFRHFKDAWRNHVNHSRAHYGEAKARSVFTHVQSFINDLATGPQ